MRTENNGNGRGNGQSLRATSLIHLPDGRCVTPDVVDSPKGGRNGRMKLPPATQSLTRETQFEICPDGTLVDLVREKVGAINFVVWRDGTPSFHRTYQNEDVTLVPPRGHPSFVDAVRYRRRSGPVRPREHYLARSTTFWVLISISTNRIVSFLDTLVCVRCCPIVSRWRRICGFLGCSPAGKALLFNCSVRSADVRLLSATSRRRRFTP